MTPTTQSAIERFVKDFDEDWPSTRSYTNGRMQEWLEKHLLSELSLKEAEVEKATLERVKGVIEKRKNEAQTLNAISPTNGMRGAIAACDDILDNLLQKLLPDAQ